MLKEDNTGRWGQGTVRITLLPGRKNLQRPAQLGWRLAGCERAAALAVEDGHRVSTLTRLQFGLLASRIRPHATEDRPQPKVEKLPQRVGLDRGESVYGLARRSSDRT